MHNKLEILQQLNRLQKQFQEEHPDWTEHQAYVAARRVVFDEEPYVLPSQSQAMQGATFQTN